MQNPLNIHVCVIYDDIVVTFIDVCLDAKIRPFTARHNCVGSTLRSGLRLEWGPALTPGCNIKVSHTMMLPPLSFNRESTRDIDAYEYEHALADKPPQSQNPAAERVSPLASKAVSHSHNLHLKKIISELVDESSNMENNMINASKYYYLISYLIFYPSIILNTFIGCFVLTFTCSSFRSSHISACLATNDMDCVLNYVQNYTGDMKGISRTERAWQYLLASLAFVNAMLIGLQKTLRPAENGETFQVVARRWGAFLRQLVAYKQTTPTSSYSQRKVRLYITQFAMLMENSPLLPQHFLRARRSRQSLDGPRAPGADAAIKGPDDRGYVRQNVSSQRLSSFLVHMSPAHKHARGGRGAGKSQV